MSEVFEQQYRNQGVGAQREFPNESLIGFVRSTFGRQGGEGKKVLEIGCGSGANLWFLAREGFTTFGIDLAPSGLRCCTEIVDSWSQTASLVRGDMSVLPFFDHSFDLIVDVVSLQHLDFASHQKTLAEVKRCLASDGRFFSYHLGADSSSLSQSTSEHIDEYTVSDISEGLPLAGNGTTCFLTADHYRSLMEESGFRSWSIENIKRSYDSQTKQIEYLVVGAAA